MKNAILVSIFICVSIFNYAQESTVLDDDQKFIGFLENCLENELVNAETINAFHQRSWSYWSEHKLDYNRYPEKYKRAMVLFHQNQEKFKKNNSIEMDRFENAIENFRRFDNRNTLPKNSVLFVGSSSIVHWETSISFPEFPVINRGFGGASVSEIIYYYNDVIRKHAPAILVLYSDIDVERGKSPCESFAAYKELFDMVKNDFPKTHVLLLSMKPTLIDDFLGKDVRENKIRSNRLLIEYCGAENNFHFVDVSTPMLKPDGCLRSDIFLPDGLHLNALGYTIWNPIVRAEISSLRNL